MSIMVGTPADDDLFDLADYLAGQLDPINGPGHSELHGLGGNDRLDGAGGGDVLYGDGGNDRLIDGHSFYHADRFTGALYTTGYDDLFNGGDGFDIVDYSSFDGYSWVDTSTIEYDLAYDENGNLYEIPRIVYSGYTVDHGVVVDLSIGQATGDGADTLVGIEGVIGADRDDRLIGDARANGLDGRDGADSLAGGAGDDTLLGGAGADTLEGGAGRDSLEGGSGDDSYVVDGADTVVELAGGGFDIVHALAAFTATAGSEIERIIADGSGPVDITGNGLAMEIIGNGGINKLDDGGGAATLIGGGGVDVYRVHNAATQVIELAGEGYDTVSTDLAAYVLGDNLEVLTRLGSTAFHGVGNALANRLIGGDGADTLDGAGGADVLTGGQGADLFVFDNLASGMDWITDFTSGQDRIGLDATGFGLSRLTDVTWIDGDAATAAGQAALHYYANGAVAFDATGGGTSDAVWFVGLQGHPALTAADFVLV